MSAATIRDDVRRMCVALSAAHANDMAAVDHAIDGMPADQFARAALVVGEVAVNGLAIGMGSDFDAALREVRTQITARLP